MTLAFRTTSAYLLDIIANHPDVRPTIQPGKYRLESDRIVNDPRNVCIAGTGGAALFMWEAPGDYTGHIMLLRSTRGSQGLAFGKAALALLFDRYDALIVRAVISKALPAAAMYVRRLGFLSKGDSLSGSEQVFHMEKSNV